MLFYASLIGAIIATQFIGHSLSKENPSQHEIRLQQLKEKAIRQETQDWIFKQMQDFSAEGLASPTDSFFFEVGVKEVIEFRWTAQAKKQHIISISIFTASQQGFMNFMKEPNQHQYLQILCSSYSSGIRVLQGKIYIKRTFKIYFEDTAVKLQFLNHYGVSILGYASLKEELQEKILEPRSEENVGNNFKALHSQLTAIKEYISNYHLDRAIMEKWEWGFLEQENNHQAVMLKLTAVELIVIMATTFMQIYCIKNLFDNPRLI